MKQSQPLRIEHPDHASFTTSKTVQARLWFVNNRAFERRVLGYVAKYVEKYGVILHSVVFQGNHIHLCARFPKCNRALFFRDLNARIAEAARALIPEFGGGHLFARRYAEQALAHPKDLEDYFLYCALQPVSAGLCERIGSYPGYNSVWDATNGVEKKYKVVDWTRYRRAKSRGLKVKSQDFTKYYPLKFSRLPGYEDLPQAEYRAQIIEKLEARRSEIVEQWKKQGHRFMTEEELRRVEPGSLPYKTKSSKRTDKRPLILTKSLELKRAFLAWYFSVYAAYKAAVKRFFAGELDVEFPPNTYRPPGLLIRAKIAAPQAA